MSNLTPAQVPHPGKIIQKELGARGWSVRDLAEKMGRPEPDIRAIIEGFSFGFSAGTAIQLGEAFGTSAELWARMSADYMVWRERRRLERSQERQR